ncbi:MAG TPA: hypothetical protein VJZ49_15040 [Syntrophales bacterium]|nr:hypothetical protein [Syntrophales bacterium]
MPASGMVVILKLPARSRFLHEESFPAYGIPSGAVHQRGEEGKSALHRSVPRNAKWLTPIGACGSEKQLQTVTCLCPGTGRGVIKQ